MYPETSEQKRAGMAAFRATMLKGHKLALQSAKSAFERERQRDLIAIIESAQRKYGEVAQ